MQGTNQGIHLAEFLRTLHARRERSRGEVPQTAVNTIACVGGCGTTLEADWSRGYREPICPACRERRDHERRMKTMAVHLRQASLPSRFMDYHLSRRMSARPDEPLWAFLRRLPPGTLGVTAANHHALEALDAWLSMRSRPSLWLQGQAGSGKTLLLCLLARSLLEEGIPVLYLTEMGFLSQVSTEKAGPDQPAGLLSRAIEAPVLLLDDANPRPHRAQAPQPWMTRAMFGLVNGRYNQGRTTLFASRGGLLEYGRCWQYSREEGDSDWLAGRLFEMCEGQAVLLEEEDWRKALVGGEISETARGSPA